MLWLPTLRAPITPLGRVTLIALFLLSFLLLMGYSLLAMAGSQEPPMQDWIDGGQE
jgi:hypothetical protein